jgi:hypothetical protein
MLIKVKSREKQCDVIINLDHVMEISPLRDGGTAIRMLYDGDITQKTGYREIYVENKFSEFEQFVLQTVTTDVMSKKVEELKKQQEKLGKKEKVALKSGEDEIEIPTFSTPTSGKADV